MLLFSSHHRCGDQFVQQNSSERNAAPASHPALPTPPGTSVPFNSFLTQTQYNSHLSETSCYTDLAPLQSKSADPINRIEEERKEEKHVQSQSPPLLKQQSLRDLQSSSSSYEPPDTDPSFIQALWNEVTCFGNAQNPPEDLLGVNIMDASATKEYDLPGFSSAAFPLVLEQYQVTIKEKDPSFWMRVRQAIEAAPAGIVSDESCKVWGGNDESTKAKAEANAKDLVAKLKALIIDPDSTLFDHQQLVTDQLLRDCLLPGVKVFNNPKMFNVKTEPYHLISASIGNILTQPIRREFTRPISPPRPTNSSAAARRRPASQNAAQSTISSAASQRRLALQSATQPTKIHPSTLSKLDLPRDMMDCAYWLEASELHPLAALSIAQETFVSNGTNRKTSPYLSIAFGNLECESFPEQNLLVKHKIAVYGSTALYNRHLLYAKASKIGGSSNMGLKRSIGDLHFGLVLVEEEATLYVFQCEEDLSENDQAAAWHGCNMSKIGRWTLTVPNQVEDMLYHLRIVADWVRRVYVPVLHDDLAQLS